MLIHLVEIPGNVFPDVVKHFIILTRFFKQIHKIPIKFIADNVVFVFQTVRLIKF